MFIVQDIVKMVKPDPRYNSWLCSNAEFGVLISSYEYIFYKIIWKMNNGERLTMLHGVHEFEVIE